MKLFKFVIQSLIIFNSFLKDRAPILLLTAHQSVKDITDLCVQYFRAWCPGHCIRHHGFLQFQFFTWHFIWPCAFCSLIWFFDIMLDIMCSNFSFPWLSKCLCFNKILANLLKLSKLSTNNLPLWQILSKTYLDISWAGMCRWDQLLFIIRVIMHNNISSHGSGIH